LGCDGADEALGPLGDAWEVEELCGENVRWASLFTILTAIMDGRTILRRCAGEQAISVEVVIRTIFWCLGIQTFV
jgi:hypothetical protein